MRKVMSVSVQFLVVLTLVMMGIQTSLSQLTQEQSRVEEFVKEFLKASEVFKSNTNKCNTPTDQLIVRQQELVNLMQGGLTKKGFLAHEFSIKDQPELGKVHLSDSCAECAAAGVSCGRTNCWRDCILNSCSQGCQNCFLQSCMKEVLACTGVDKLPNPCS